MTVRMRPFSLAALAVALLVVLAAAPAFAQDTGSADFSRFVAIGDSLGAGFVSGGLVRGAQEDSVPALVARQATGATISQPLISEPGQPPLLRLVSLSPLVIDRLPGGGTLVAARPYQNLSIPGYRIGDALRTVTGGAANRLIDAVLQGRGTQLMQAVAQNPTFALVWLGNNDVLAAATSGVVIDGVTLTPTDQFEADLRAIVGTFNANGADVVLANLPDVTSIPYVTTIPPVVVNPATSQPVLGPNGQPIPLIGPNGNLSLNDKVLLPASAKLAAGIGIPTFLGGTGVALENEDVLSAAEVDAIQARVDSYNAIIQQVANETGSALADINGLLRQVASHGINLGGITFTEDFITGGSFSLDGVHPTPLGYGVAANVFIDAINETFDANIPPVDLFPFIFGDDSSAIPSIPGALTGFVFTAGASQQLLDVLRVWQPATPPGDTARKPQKRIDGPWKLPSRPKG